MIGAGRQTTISNVLGKTLVPEPPDSSADGIPHVAWINLNSHSSESHTDRDWLDGMFSGEITYGSSFNQILPKHR